MAYCARCGNTLEEGASFCTACGTPTTAATRSAAVTPAGQEQDLHYSLAVEGKLPDL